MPASVFHFRQFSIHQDRCAMKVGTDGILLGAWAPLESASRILDVGTGTGLLALMAAQRAPKAHIVGIEIDPSAAAQAHQNVANSPWADRITIEQADLLSWEAPMEFDHIICNPPYFDSGQASAERARAVARHMTGEVWQNWLIIFQRTITNEGAISLIIPSEKNQKLLSDFQRMGFKGHKLTWVHPRQHTAPNRCLFTFSALDSSIIETHLDIYEGGNHYTPLFKSLTKDFYL